MNMQQFINDRNQLGMINGNHILCLNFKPVNLKAGKQAFYMLKNLNDKKPVFTTINTVLNDDYLMIGDCQHSYAHIKE